MRKMMLSVVVLLGSLVCFQAFAAPITVGTVDARKIGQVMQKFRLDQKEATKDFKADKDAMTKLRETVKTERAKLKNKKLSEAKKKAITAKVAKIQKDLTAKQTAMRTKMMDQRTAKQKQMLKKFKSAVAKVARKQKVDIVVPSQTVFFADKEVDLTDAVVKALEKQR